VHDMERVAVNTEIYGPNAGAGCNIENIVDSFAQGCEMKLPV